MAISIDWDDKIIFVPQADLTPSGPNLYELDIDTFRLALKDLEASQDGVTFLDTHKNTTPLSVGTTTFARVIEIINGYTITFQDVGTPYAVDLVGANSNISTVVNINNVSVRSNNSAGLITTGGANPNDIANAVLDEILSSHNVPGSLAAEIKKKLSLSTYIALK